MKKICLILFIVSAFLISCEKDDSSSSNPTQPGGQENQRTKVLDVQNRKLSEDYYFYSNSISLYNGEVSKTGNFDLLFNLESWPEDYGLELFVMEELEFAKYQENLSFRVKFRQTIMSPGTHQYSTSRFTGGNYRIVVDNTNMGWEDTDFDLVDDEAKYDLTVWLLE